MNTERSIDVSSFLCVSFEKVFEILSDRKGINSYHQTYNEYVSSAYVTSVFSRRLMCFERETRSNGKQKVCYNSEDTF